MIRAYASIPAYDDVRFDASPWFAESSPAAIMALVREEWSGKPARAMADAMGKQDGYGNLELLLDYKRAHRNDISGHKLELEIFVDAADALAWLSEHRPEIRASIEHEYGDDALQSERSAASWADWRDPEGTKYLRPAEPGPAPR